MTVVNVRALLILTCLSILGCTQNGNQDTGGSSPADDGWVRVGQVKIAQERDEDVVSAEHVPGFYSKLRLEADGPAQIHRIVLTYHDGTVELPQNMPSFTGAGSDLIPINNQKKIDRVALIFSGAKLMKKTTLTLWVK
jgi:hypothetical protein